MRENQSPEQSRSLEIRWKKTEILPQYPQQTQKETIIALGQICSHSAKKPDEVKIVNFS